MQKLNDYQWFMVQLGLFIFISGFAVWIYVVNQQPLDLKANKKAVEIEVSLPVVEWAKYENISKKIEEMSASLMELKKVGRKKIARNPDSGNGTQQAVVLGTYYEKVAD
jgi:hypothetical protein